MLHKTILHRAALVFATFLNTTPIRAQERAYLDATQVQIRQRQREPTTGNSGGVVTGYSDGKSPAQPLALSLKISANTGLIQGQAFDYEVQIRNASDRPVELPCDLSPADVEPADPRKTYQYRSAGVHLSAKLANGRAVSMQGPILLFGAPAIGSTLVELQPGEWVRIKAKGRMIPANPNDVWPPSNLTSNQVQGTLTATLMLYDDSVTLDADGTSHELSRMMIGSIWSAPLAIQFNF